MISSNKTKGFTLVELLIVIVVIAILAAISIVAYNGVTNKARDDERASDARSILNAAAAYNADNDKWPGASDLKGFDTIKLSSKALDGLGVATASGAVAEAADPNSGDKGKFGYKQCKDTSSAITGIQVTYWKDVLADGDPSDHLIRLKTGANC